MAESFGVDTARLKTIVFLYAALFAGAVGLAVRAFPALRQPERRSTSTPGIDYLFMAVIGGASHVWGAVIGASILTLLKEWLKDVLPTSFGASGNYEIVVFGVLMLLLLQRASRRPRAGARALAVAPRRRALGAAAPRAAEARRRRVAASRCSRCEKATQALRRPGGGERPVVRRCSAARSSA